MQLQSLLPSLIKACNQINDGRAGTVLSYLLRTLRHSRQAFDMMADKTDFLTKIVSIEKEFLDGLRRDKSWFACSPNHTSIRSCVVHDTRSIQALLERRDSQVSLISDGKFEAYCATVHYESDEEVELDPLPKEIDLRDKDEQWRKVTLRRMFGDVVEFIKTTADGSRSQDYLMNSEDRVAMPNTATLEYLPGLMP